MNARSICHNGPRWYITNIGGKIPAPTEIQIQKAQEFARNKVREHMVQHDLISSSMEDWRDACLLEQYFEIAVKAN